MAELGLGRGADWGSGWSPQCNLKLITLRLQFLPTNCYFSGPDRAISPVYLRVSVFRQYLVAKVVGATSSERFLVHIGYM